jgi:hypothetical protein
MQPGAGIQHRCIHTTVKELHLNRIMYRILSIVSHVLPLLNVLALFVTSNHSYVGVKNLFWNYFSTLLWKACRNTDMNWHKLYERQYKSNASYFFSETVIYNGNEIYIYHGYILYKVEIIFPPSLLHFLKHVTFQLIIHKTAYSEFVFQEPEKMEVGGG